VLHEVFDGPFIGHIQRLGQYLGARAFTNLRRRRVQFLGVARADGYASAFGGKFLCSRASDSTARRSNDHIAVLQSKIH
jgi:hypothetical protein